MPVGTPVHNNYPNDYPAPKKYVLVLSCVDYRLLDDLVRFLDHDNLTNRYYHIALAGAALGVGPNPPVAHAKTFAGWRQTFIDHVRATVTLTEGKLTDIYIVQHEDCGAFKLYDGKFECMNLEDQLERNRYYAKILQDDISEHFCGDYNPPYESKCINKCDEEVVVESAGSQDKPTTATGTVQHHPPIVHTFFMDLRGNVERLSAPVSAAECEEWHCGCPPVLVAEPEKPKAKMPRARRAKK